MHLLRQVRKPRADLNAVCAGVDGFHAAHFRSARFRVKSIHMTEAPAQVEIDDTLRSRRARGFRAKQVRQKGYAKAGSCEASDELVTIHCWNKNSGELRRAQITSSSGVGLDLITS